MLTLWMVDPYWEDPIDLPVKVGEYPDFSTAERAIRDEVGKEFDDDTYGDVIVVDEEGQEWLYQGEWILWKEERRVILESGEWYQVPESRLGSTFLTLEEHRKLRGG